MLFPPSTDTIRRAQAGDELAMDSLVESCFWWADQPQRRARCDGLDGDLIRDLFVDKVKKGVGGVRNPERFEAWSNTTYRRTRQDVAREARRNTWLCSDELAGTAAPARCRPDLTAARAELVAAVHVGIEALPPDQRIALIRFLDGYLRREIAEELQVSEGTVATRILLARKRVIKHLLRRGFSRESIFLWE